MKHRLLLAFLVTIGFLPANAQFNWQHTGGPQGGVYWPIYNNDDYAFYADQYYLYRTNDGIDWEKLPENAIWPMAVRGSTLVGQFYQEKSFLSDLPTTLKISHDNGETWTEINKPPVSFIEHIAICSHGIYILQWSEHLLYRSQDEGLTWDTLSPPFQYGYNTWVFEDRLYVSNTDHLYRTDTNGENWTSVTPPLAAEEYVEGVFAHGLNLLVATGNNLWHSHDDGQTWHAIPSSWQHGTQAFTLVGNEIFSTSGSTGLSKSGNYGLSLHELPASSDNLSIFYLATAGGKALATTYNQGIFRWEETAHSLVEANNGLGSAAIYTLATGDGKIWAGTANGVFAYDPPQQTWTHYSSLPLPEHYYETIVAEDSGLVCAAQWIEDHFYLSTDGGFSWSVIYPDFGFLGGGILQQIRIFDHVIFAEDQFDSWVRSTDLGHTWQLISGLSSPTPLQDIFQFNGLYMATDHANNFYTSPDQGLSWNIYAAFTNGDMQQLFVTADRLFVYAYSQAGTFIYTSTDGISWKYAHDGLPSNIYYSTGPGTQQQVDFFGYAGEYFFYHSELGFYASTDTCKTWLPVEHKPYHFVTMTDSVFYTGGFGGGVVRSGLPNVYGTLVSGTVFNDDNGNGIRDDGESGIPRVRVGLEAPNAWNPFYMTNTREDGTYVLGVIPGTYDTLHPLPSFHYLESISPPYRLVGNGGDNLDFGIKLTPNITDLSIIGKYIGRPRPGFDVGLAVQYTNAGTTEPDAVLSIKLDGHLAYLNAFPSPTAVFGDSLVWSLAQLPLFSSGYVQVNTHLSATTPLGLALTSICHVETAAPDATPADNQKIISDTVVGAYDPNEKRVEPADGLTAGEIAIGKEILYTIQFQNTGTSPAERVRITDLLDTALYLPSLRLVVTSHPISNFHLNPGGLLEIVFDHILLPDSNSSEVASHGFVTFAVQRKKAFRANYVVRNYAAIYFDFNEPILTNEVTTPLKAPSVSVNDPQEKWDAGLRIFPNPADPAFTIFAEGRLSGPGWLTLQNTAGQICQQRRVADLGVSITVQTSGLPDGLYLVRLSGGEKSLVGRVVVQRR